MKEVKTQKRYKCDFCKKRGIKRKMIFHEQNCYQNPNRLCSYCENDGWKYESAGDENDTQIKVNCPYCSAFDKQKFEDIKKYKELLPIISPIK